jgi:hypothetical protein
MPRDDLNASAMDWQVIDPRLQTKQGAEPHPILFDGDLEWDLESDFD